MSTITTDKRIRRHKRIRAKMAGTPERPRLSVYKSNKRLYAQVIDDVAGVTMVAISDDTTKGATKTERAREAGRAIAKAAMDKGVKAVVFDRGGYIYVGRIRALAEGAREGGLIF
ncbi:MAG: 50S ribosomal protein L18 [Candidatus Yonathbacteria bacterium]|nr:50S ribosomal protein L18 [Candidatus Yonathbacteria bacterium]